MKLGYARVSTVDQNPQLQLVALKKAGCTKIYTEYLTGAKRERPELVRALEQLRAGDTFVVWKLDRLARSVPQLVETVNRLQDQKVHFVSLTETIDTKSPTGKLIFHVFAAIAEFERELIRERTLAALAVARAMGKLGGRPPAIDAKGLRQLRALLRDESITRVQIAERMGVSEPTLYRYMRQIRREDDQK